jgi:Flp pilus assembly protein TadD
MGLFAVKRGQSFYPSALAEFERSAALNPEFAPAQVNLGNLYLAFGRRSDARRAFAKALSLKPNPLAEEQLRLLDAGR